MDQSVTIAELTDICVRQARIIKAQAEILSVLGAEALEDRELAERLETVRQIGMIYEEGEI